MQLLKFKQKTQKFFNILKFHPVLMQWNQAALMRFFCSLWHENAFEKHFVFLCKGFSNLLLNQQILWCTVGNFLWIWLPSGKSYFQLKHIIMLHAFKVAYLICLYIVETEMFAHQKKRNTSTAEWAPHPFYHLEPKLTGNYGMMKCWPERKDTN